MALDLEPRLTTLDALEPRGAGGIWEAVVVGAGPAGAVAARELALAGREVLLIDRQSFPRDKVCGGCLNRRTLALLASAGLDGVAESLGGVPLRRFELWTAGRHAGVPLPRGMAVSRAALDAELARRAVAAGVRFLSGTRAALGPARDGARAVRLPGSGREVRARVVLAADGLGGSFLSGDAGHRARAVPGSRLGAGAVLSGEGGGYREGVIYMAVGRSGYVGLARVERGRLDVAAALDRGAARGPGGLAGAVARIVEEAGLPPLGALEPRWRGTAPLTRRAPRVALERVFLVGDAAGYVEPFTGEGISWALETALSVAPLANQTVHAWRDALGREWQRRYRRRIARRQRWCRGVAWGLRRPALVRLAADAVARAPRLAAPLVSHLNAAPAGSA